jgi:DNA-directed RNA polymerase delta subunit
LKIYRKNEATIAASLGESLVILNTENLKYFELTDVASRIWELLDESPMTIPDLCSRLLEEFEVSASNCEHSVTAFLEDATTRGLVIEE